MSRKLEIEKEVGINFKSCEFEINKNTINQFEFMENRRLLRIAHVKSIKRMILSGTNFDAPIIINEINKRKRILDGQHRIYAIKEVLSLNSKFKIRILLVTYKELTKTQEKEIFSRYNKGARQSSDDFVQMYYDSIPISQFLSDSAIPISIYNEKGKLKFWNLMKGYFWGIRGNNVVYSGNEFVAKCSKMTKKDAEEIKKFIKEFKENIGQNNFSSKSSALHSIMVCWMRTNLPKNEFWKRLNERVVPSEKFTMLCNIAGNTSTALLIEMIKEKCEKKDIVKGISEDIQRERKKKDEENNKDDGSDVDFSNEGDEEE